MEEKSPVKPKKIRQIDEIDRRILNILAQNSRSKLLQIAKQIGLSIDSTKKRIKKLEENKIITKYTIQVNDIKLGYPIAAHIYVKLKDITKEKLDEFISYLQKEIRVIDLMSMLGDYDIYIVIISKDTLEMDEIKMEIRQKFSSLIDEWKEVLVTKIYKLEEYRF